MVKLHGDYLDTRIKNTPAELDSYDEVINELLDRIIEEHGFIVCGWSAAWDTALRRAFERRKGSRYTTYWVDVVPPGEHASRLIEMLGADFIQVKGADDFFTDIVDKVKSLGDDGGVKTETRAPTGKAKHNLPVQLTSFIGREDEIAEIYNLLSMAPLVTLTGSGGAGKTRLAQEIGSENVSVYPDGVWLVGFAPLSDPTLVAEEVSSVVGEEALFDYLEDKVNPTDPGQLRAHGGRMCRVRRYAASASPKCQSPCDQPGGARNCRRDKSTASRLYWSRPRPNRHWRP